MKRYLAIFLLTLLPLQFCWAAMAVYCSHESSVTTNHPGHHTHEHRSADQHDSGKDDAPSAGVHHDCVSCHSSCAAVLTGHLKTPKVVTDRDPPFDYHVNFYRAFTERPERPQWPRLA
jgi:hypothetical protein